MIPQLLTYLGQPMSDVLAAPPFKAWTYTHSVDEGLPKSMTNAHYEYHQNGCALSCGAERRLTTIFLYANEFGGFDLKGAVTFSMSRDHILSLYKAPSRSGEAHYSPGLGQIGPWHRFDTAEHATHFQFYPDKDQIKQITMMTLDTAP